MKTKFRKIEKYAYLEEGFAFAWCDVGEVLFPLEERVLFEDLEVVEGDKPAKEHAFREVEPMAEGLQRMEHSNLKGDVIMEESLKDGPVAFQ